MTRLILALLEFYHKGISPFLGAHCRFDPSCSVYLKEAILRRGLAGGFCQGLFRLLRCHPFSDGGHDPVRPDT